ncbi:hypothetical protein, partial [Klebsiella michiganensis]|uniref:hypothetical protein n=1 Tax=Klebsiella michiganensis TaxID=1134687 RepID=UPI001BD4C6DC
KLEQNYRSSGRILKAANILIANNPHVFEKRLFSELGYGVELNVPFTFCPLANSIISGMLMINSVVDNGVLSSSGKRYLATNG